MSIFSYTARRFNRFGKSGERGGQEVKADGFAAAALGGACCTAFADTVAASQRSLEVTDSESLVFKGQRTNITVILTLRLPSR